MRPADTWKDYELLDATDGNRLERWGETILIRPDPQVVWKTPKQSPLWAKADAVYHRSNQGGGEWEYKRRLPEKWKISCGEGEDKLTLIVSPTGFKHTGVFPEQAVNWAWYAKKIRAAGRPVKVLNLFGYTGGATLACAAAGATVCHVDASKGIVAWGKDNAVASGLADRPIRWLVDDCAKFVAREKRRGNTYDGIIMDPPSYGRGPGGEIWKLEDCIYDLISQCEEVLSDTPLFFAVNSYTTGLSPAVMEYMLKTTLVPRFGGKTSCDEIGLPVLMRPSYVLGGQNMIVAYTKADVIEYMGVITEHVDMDHPVLLDKYILGTECEVDAICDGENFLIPGIMEQVERTGVHSGDSICVYPAQHLTQAEIDTMVDYTGRFARELHVNGLVNVQYAVSNGKVYVIEVNPRSSRTVPYISKVTGVPMVDLAVRCCLGEKLADMGYGTGLHPNAPYVAVKVPVFSFEKLHGVDTQFGPEMKSTGEVLGIAPNYHDALLKGLIGAGYTFKTPGPASCCIFTVKDSDKPEFVDIAWKLKSMGYKLYGTSGTCAWLNKHMVPCNEVRNMSGESPNIVDLLQSGLVDYVFSTSAKGRDPKRDSVRLRRKAVELSIPCITAVDTANALVDCLRSDHSLENIPLVDIATLYHRK